MALACGAGGGFCVQHLEHMFLNYFCHCVQEKRLRDRKTETEESLMKRLTAARIDLELSKCRGLWVMCIRRRDALLI